MQWECEIALIVKDYWKKKPTQQSQKERKRNAD